MLLYSLFGYVIKCKVSQCNNKQKIRYGIIVLEIEVGPVSACMYVLWVVYYKKKYKKSLLQFFFLFSMLYYYYIIIPLLYVIFWTFFRHFLDI